MHHRSKERRHYHPYLPYMFFLLELVIYAELAYMVLAVLGSTAITYAVIGLIFLYQFYKSFTRLHTVLQRNKTLIKYKKFQKKLQNKILQR